MSERSNIAWTDSTWNPWRGCTKVSAGCANCYAETLVTTRLQGEWGKGKPRQREKNFGKAVLRWNKKPWICEQCGGAHTHAEMHSCPTKDSPTQLADQCTWHRRRVFSLSLGDVWDVEVPAPWLADTLRVVSTATELDFLLLTKRPGLCKDRLVEAYHACTDLALRHWLSRWMNGHPPANVWIGTSVENQATADERIPALCRIPAACRFLSVEPMLERIDLKMALEDFQPRNPDLSLKPAPIQWAIFGGESGSMARPCNTDWIRDGVRQCLAAGVAPFVKQLGTYPVHPDTDIDIMLMLDSASNRDHKGGYPLAWPADLRDPALRKFPIVTARQQALASDP